MSTIETPADPCECGDEYGPCELHCKVWAQREGASHRTADELALCLVDDLTDIYRTTRGQFGAVVPAEDAAWLDRVRGLLDGSMDGRWLDDADDSQALYELAYAMESDASGLWITHEDGYVIAEVTGGPLFDDDVADMSAAEAAQCRGWEG